MTFSRIIEKPGVIWFESEEEENSLKSANLCIPDGCFDVRNKKLEVWIPSFITSHCISGQVRTSFNWSHGIKVIKSHIPALDLLVVDLGGQAS